MARYKKGESGNPNGRPKGAVARTTKEMKEALQFIIDNNLYRLQEDLDRMSPGVRWGVLEKLKKYVIPTMSQTKVDAEVSGDIKIKIVYEDELGKEEDDMNNLDDNDIDLDR